ncbi:hypothetical protein [Bacillus pumilus]|uniref:hypothetical protein n=1 Tax=Bacillus pumilus TaxID=1408 RepID=UPI0011A2FE48|nr:hypothetical protein [Bacillus pumilus]
MRALMECLFKVLLVLFLTSGTLLVFGQILGILLQNGDLIIASTNLFKNPTLVLSAFFSLVGFSLHYIPEKKDTSFSDQPSVSAGDSVK